MVVVLLQIKMLLENPLHLLLLQMLVLENLLLLQKLLHLHLQQKVLVNLFLLNFLEED
jgi:hypothetical protein